MIATTGDQLALLHHALGLRPDRREPYRNHFVAGPGHASQSDLEILESAGLVARVKTPAFCDTRDVVFACTGTGKGYAIDNLPPLPEQPKRSRYCEYLSCDGADSFADWLGIRKPKFEVRGFRWSQEYRMFRPGTSIGGEWRATKKAAKESYKAALGSRRSAP